MTLRSLPPLVVHLMHRFDTGGLENGVVNLINHMPRGAYRHMVVALTEIGAFRQRLCDSEIVCVGLGKQGGHGARLYPALWRLLRQHRPAIVHSRNLGTLEMQVAAWAARVPVRIHGEHGRDVDDLNGSSRKHQRLRRLYAPWVQHWVALSKDLERYLSGPVGITPSRIQQIYNGVDADRFRPAVGGVRQALPGSPFNDRALFVFGTVGRMAAVKNQTLLVEAFVLARAADPAFAESARLVLVGDGPLRLLAQAVLQEAGAAAAAWVPGERADVPDVMRCLDCFVLPSLAEGISNTILEAMASGLPVVATDVGGNAELVAHGQSGSIVASGDAHAMAGAMLNLWRQRGAARDMGRAGRVQVERRFSLQAMVGQYQALYDQQLAEASSARGKH